ncbi:MAG: hypothetical protein OXG78_01400 [Chloroflexi bacterium]|nr:hypothetical protein [Chloroflexota bacterium]
MLKSIALRASIVFCSIILTLLAIEWGLRTFGDPDGDRQLLGYRLRPARIDMYHARVYLERYLENIDKASLVYDEILGWTYPPYKVVQDGKFTTNSIGIRAQKEYPIAPPVDTLRIVILGDSFVADVDVTDEESWGTQLEIMLNQRGIRAEVLNFGVSGYGMGQAYLRWQHSARDFSPDIVIFGVQPENLNRNVNIFRTIYLPGETVPLAKPRFVLTKQGLDVVNLPVVPPEELIQVYRNLGNHPLATYEFYYNSRHLSSEWWTESRLIVFVQDLLHRNTPSTDDYSRTSERVQLGISLIDALAAEVEESGGIFTTIHFPMRHLLGMYHEGRESPFGEFLQYVEDTYDYIPMEKYLVPKYLEREYWGETFHYGPQISQLVAEVLADEITDCVNNRTCTFSRFEEESEFQLQ